MRTSLITVGIGLVTYSMTLAQSSDLIRIKGGVGGEKAVPFMGRYRYDQFLGGKILYRNGSTAWAKLNYNVLLGEMQFIDPQGDTLALANEPIVGLVNIDGPASADRLNVFWYDPAKRYLEIVADYGSVKLAIKHGLRVAKSEKLAGYDQSSGTSAITNYNFYASGSAPVRKLDEKGDLVLIKSRTYYMIDQNSRSYPINKSNVLKIFSKYRDQVATYIAGTTVDFDREEDLKKLLTHCSELNR